MSSRVMRGFDRTRLTQARIDMGLTRGELGRLAGVTEAAIGRWETGKRTPRIDVLTRVLTCLDTDIEDIVYIHPTKRFPGDWRILRGLTQPLLGKAAGISTAAISRMERGEGGLTPELRERVATALGITPDELTHSFERARSRPPGEPA